MATRDELRILEGLNVSQMRLAETSDGLQPKLPVASVKSTGKGDWMVRG